MMKTEGVGVMKDKELKLEEIEASHRHTRWIGGRSIRWSDPPALGHRPLVRSGGNELPATHWSEFLSQCDNCLLSYQ